MAEPTLQEILAERTGQLEELQRQRQEALKGANAQTPDVTTEQLLGRVLASGLPVALAAAFGGKRAAGLAAGPAQQTLQQMSQRDEIAAERRRREAALQAQALGQQIGDVRDEMSDLQKMALKPQLAADTRRATLPFDIARAEAAKPQTNIVNNIPGPLEEDPGTNPLGVKIGEKERTATQKKLADKTLQSVAPQAKAVDELISLYENGLNEGQFTGEDAQRASQLLTVIKNNNIVIGERGAAISPAEMKLLDGAVGVIDGRDLSLTSAFAANIKRLGFGDNPAFALRKFRGDFKTQAEQRLQANRTALNFNNPDIAAAFPEGSTLTGRGTTTRKQAVNTLKRLIAESKATGDNSEAAKAERRFLIDRIKKAAGNG